MSKKIVFMGTPEFSVPTLESLVNFVIVVAYGKIIPKRFLNLSKHGFINVHASLLPKWRGAAPIQRSIMNMDSIFFKKLYSSSVSRFDGVLILRDFAFA